MIDETLPVEEQVRQAREVIAGALDATMEIERDQEDLRSEIREIEQEIANLEERRRAVHQEMEQAKRVLDVAERFSGRQLKLFDE